MPEMQGKTKAGDQLGRNFKTYVRNDENRK